VSRDPETILSLPDPFADCFFVIVINLLAVPLKPCAPPALEQLRVRRGRDSGREK